MPTRPMINKNVMTHFPSTDLLCAQKIKQNFEEAFISDESWLKFTQGILNIQPKQRKIL